VHLWVTETNKPAQLLYEHCGFSLTGERQPLPSNPALGRVGMARPLDSGTGSALLAEGSVKGRPYLSSVGARSCVADRFRACEVMVMDGSQAALPPSAGSASMMAPS
jgi:hypothetical protein